MDSIATRLWLVVKYSSDLLGIVLEPGKTMADLAFAFSRDKRLGNAFGNGCGDARGQQCLADGWPMAGKCPADDWPMSGQWPQWNKIHPVYNLSKYFLFVENYPSNFGCAFWIRSGPLHSRSDILIIINCTSCNEVVFGVAIAS